MKSADQGISQYFWDFTKKIHSGYLTVKKTAGDLVGGKAANSKSAVELRAIIDSYSAVPKPSIIQKIFLGVNSNGNFIGLWRAGDTRTELSMLMNGLTMMVILSVWAAGAYVLQKREERIQLYNLRREVEKEHEYREV